MSKCPTPGPTFLRFLFLLCTRSCCLPPPPFRPRAAKFDFTLIIACAQLDMSHERVHIYCLPKSFPNKNIPSISCAVRSCFFLTAEYKKQISYFFSNMHVQDFVNCFCYLFWTNLLFYSSL